MRSFVRVSGSRQETAEEGVMCGISEAAGGMPFLPGTGAAQIGTVLFLQNSSIVAQGIQCDHQDVMGANNGIHICHNRYKRPFLRDMD